MSGPERTGEREVRAGAKRARRNRQLALFDRVPNAAAKTWPETSTPEAEEVVDLDTLAAAVFD